MEVPIEIVENQSDTSIASPAWVIQDHCFALHGTEFQSFVLMNMLGLLAINKLELLESARV